MSGLGSMDIPGAEVVGHGTATVAELTEKRPGQRASRYADPVSWLVLDAVDDAVRGCEQDLLPAKESVGHVVVSDHCTSHTMRRIAADLAAGRISPLRFSGAIPGAICGLPCQKFGFTGPTMTLSMSLATGLPAALTLARVWLRQEAATHVLVTSHHVDAAGHHAACTVFTQPKEGD